MNILRGCPHLEIIFEPQRVAAGDDGGAVRSEGRRTEPLQPSEAFTEYRLVASVSPGVKVSRDGTSILVTERRAEVELRHLERVRQRHAVHVRRDLLQEGMDRNLLVASASA